MNMRFLFQVLMGSSLAGLYCSAAVAGDAQITNITSFDIPFVVEAGDSSAVQGSALLFTSFNGGPFEQSLRVPATAGSFHFTAPSDGRYGFAVRMADVRGQLTDASQELSSELNVIVDTASPALILRLAEIAPGRLNITWGCEDREVAPGSLRLEYAEGLDGRWRPLQVADTTSGQTQVSVNPGTSVSVRGFVSDLAGNQGTGTAQIVLSATRAIAQPRYAAPQADLMSAGSGGRMESGIYIHPQKTSRTLGPNPFRSEPVRPVTIPQTKTQTEAVPAVAAASPLLVSDQKDLPVSVMPDELPEPAVPQDSQASAPVSRQVQQDAVAPPVSLQAPVAAAPVAQPLQPQTQPQQALPAGAAESVNNRVFDIAYEVQDVGPSGVGSVELFVTEDGGQTWFKYGNDDDLKSPIQVDSRGEGEFGFAVRVRNGLGFGDPPPQPGQAPAVVVVVDHTPPVLNLLEPKIYPEENGRVHLQWQLEETRPHAAPVRLEYAVNPSGPWTPLFDWQNRTEYEMPIEPGMPMTLYFRVLARDAAGNIATAQTPRPVMIDQSRPSVRVLRVRPVSASGTY